MEITLVEKIAVSSMLQGLIEMFDAANNDYDCQKICQYLQQKIEVAKTDSNITPQSLYMGLYKLRLELGLIDLEVLDTVLDLILVNYDEKQIIEEAEGSIAQINYRCASVKKKVKEEYNVVSEKAIKPSPEQIMLELAWKRSIKLRFEDEIRKARKYPNLHNDNTPRNLIVNSDEVACLLVALQFLQEFEEVQSSKILMSQTKALIDLITEKASRCDNGEAVTIPMYKQDCETLIGGLQFLHADQKKNQPFFKKGKSLKLIDQTAKKLISFGFE